MFEPWNLEGLEHLNLASYAIKSILDEDSKRYYLSISYILPINISTEQHLDKRHLSLVYLAGDAISLNQAA